MVKTSDINMLDCTLRDGGYVNNWRFQENEFRNIVEGLAESGIPYIELGIFGKHDASEFSTKFCDLLQIPYCRKRNAKFTVMGTYAEMNRLTIHPCSETKIDIIRTAYFKEDYRNALLFADRIRDLGYEVFLQAMATFMYSDDELSDMIREVNQMKPSVFYMVDSFGTMLPEDVIHMFQIINDKLDRDIGIGFHAHNNMQMAFANSILFLNLAEQHGRKIFLDASLYGMGRGAGNMCLELMLEYLNQKKGGNYDIEKILCLIHENICPLLKQYFWGYSDIYYLTARRKVSAAYVWYLGMKGILDFAEIDAFTKKIPEGKKHALDKALADRLIRESGL